MAGSLIMYQARVRSAVAEDYVGRVEVDDVIEGGDGSVGAGRGEGT
jgi:hypothetical protein